MTDVLAPLGFFQSAKPTTISWEARTPGVDSMASLSCPGINLESSKLFVPKGITHRSLDVWSSMPEMSLSLPK